MVRTHKSRTTDDGSIYDARTKGPTHTNSRVQITAPAPAYTQGNPPEPRVVQTTNSKRKLSLKPLQVPEVLVDCV